jgi:hypothetical protein
MTTIINGVNSSDRLLTKLIETIESNNSLLNENNGKITEQNKTMIKYTRAIYILTGIIVIISILQLIF